MNCTNTRDLTVLCNLYNNQSSMDEYSICCGGAYALTPEVEYHRLFKKLSPLGQKALTLSVLQKESIKVLYSGKKPTYTEISNELNENLLIPTYVVKDTIKRLQTNDLTRTPYLQKCDPILLCIASNTSWNKHPSVHLVISP